jgi:Uma2 family endonuclease
MANQAQLLTVDDLWRLPDQGGNHELVRGELREGALPVSAAARIGRLLDSYVRANKLGISCGIATKFLLNRNPDTVRAADVAFIRQKRATEMFHKEASSDSIVECVWGAPDLVMEFVSPRDLYTDVSEKLDDWLTAGTLMLWVADIRRRTITIMRPNEPYIRLTIADQLDGGDVVPGWTLPVQEVFA